MMDTNKRSRLRPSSGTRCCCRPLNSFRSSPRARFPDRPMIRVDKLEHPHMPPPQTPPHCPQTRHIALQIPPHYSACNHPHIITAPPPLKGPLGLWGRGPLGPRRGREITGDSPHHNHTSTLTAAATLRHAARGPWGHGDQFPRGEHRRRRDACTARKMAKCELGSAATCPCGGNVR